MTRPSAALVSRVDELLSDRAGVPWVERSPGARERTLAALSSADKNGGFVLRGRLRLAAAACVLLGAGALVAYVARPGPAPEQIPLARSVGLDPSPFVTPTLRLLSKSADESMTTEARGFLEDANRLTERVVAQLPFTGGG